MATDIRMPLPASEQIRTQIVELNAEISRDMRDMWTNRSGHKNTRAIRITLMARVKQLYHDTRPYMVGYKSEHMPKDDVEAFINDMDNFVYFKPDKYSLRNAMAASQFMSQFLVDYGITAVAPKKSGI